MPIETSEEITNGACSDVITFTIALGPDVDAIKPESILIDYAS